MTGRFVFAGTARARRRLDVVPGACGQMVAGAADRVGRYAMWCDLDRGHDGPCRGTCWARTDERPVLFD